jgi:hypothetical protein
MGCHDHQGAEEILQACFALHLDMSEDERKKTHNWVCSPKIHNLVSTTFGLLALLIHPQPSCLPPHMRLLAYPSSSSSSSSHYCCLFKSLTTQQERPMHALVSPYWYLGTNPVLGGYLNPLQIPSWYQPGYIGI